MAVETCADTHYETRVVTSLPYESQYHLTQPIAVLINKVDGGYEAVLFNQNLVFPSTCGLLGRTPDKAVDELCSALIRDLEFLRRTPKLGPIPKKQLIYLQSILEEKLQF